MPIISKTKIWEAKEWESWANKLIRERVGYTNFVRVPDLDKGDAGIEAYTTCGLAIQSYSPEEAVSITELAKKQKNKITRDIKKFKDNKNNRISNTLGNVKISRWILMVPKLQSQEVVAHASKKTEEILSANLPYVTDDFKIFVWDNEDFEDEHLSLLNKGLGTLKLEPGNFHESTFSDLQDNKPELIKNVADKLKKFQTSEEQVNDAVFKVIKFHVLSENMKQELKEDYPEIYREVETTYRAREDELAFEPFEATSKNQSINEQMKVISTRISEKSNFEPETLRTLSYGIVSDWLMRCPLQFK